MMRKFNVATLSFVLFWAVGPLQAELVVIGNPSMDANRIGADELYRLYKGKTKKLRNKTEVTAIDQKQGSPSRKAFYATVLKASEPQMKIYWTSKIFSGKACALRQESDDAAVKATVAKQNNCIGYIDKSLVDESVKVLYTVREPKYK
jgi:ABC-type phosphate transport system substrate-binding protein